MLLENLSEVHQSLEAAFSHDTTNTKHIREEVKKILERQKVLLWKTNSEFTAIPYVGSYRFEDGGAFDRWTSASIDYFKELLKLAGDLSNQAEPEDMFNGLTEFQKELNKAFDKLQKEGRIGEVLSLQKKYNDELKSFFEPTNTQ